MWWHNSFFSLIVSFRHYRILWCSFVLVLLEKASLCLGLVRDFNMYADMAAKEALRTDKDLLFDVFNLSVIPTGLFLCLMAEDAVFSSSL